MNHIKQVPAITITNKRLWIVAVALLEVAFAPAACDAVTDGGSSAGHATAAASVTSSDQDSGEQRQPVDFAPIPLDRLIGTAELIVVGSVEGVEEGQFEFRIEDDLTRQGASGLIPVRRAASSEVSGAGAGPPGKGQRFILFLGKPAESDGGPPWSIIGAPIAGELPVDDEYAYFDSYDLAGFDYGEWTVNGVSLSAQRFDLSAFEDAVTAYRRCFSWSLEERTKNGKVRTRWVPSRTCDKAAVRDYRGRSPLHEYLARTTLRQITADGDQDQ